MGPDHHDVWSGSSGTASIIKLMQTRQDWYDYCTVHALGPVEAECCASLNAQLRKIRNSTTQSLDATALQTRVSSMRTMQRCVPSGCARACAWWWGSALVACAVVRHVYKTPSDSLVAPWTCLLPLDAHAHAHTHARAHTRTTRVHVAHALPRWGADPTYGWPDPDFIYAGGQGCNHTDPGPHQGYCTTRIRSTHRHPWCFPWAR